MILSTITILFGLIIGVQSSMVGGVLFVLGFFVATGCGAAMRRLISGNLPRPFIMVPVTLMLFGIAFWLGSNGTINISLFDPPFRIAGEWWALLAGGFAGASVPLSEDEKRTQLRKKEPLKQSVFPVDRSIASVPYTFGTARTSTKPPEEKSSPNLPVATQHVSKRFMALCPNCRTNAEHLDLSKKHLVRCLLCSHERPTTS
jgi:hypothetical protein